jgi:hypothetical protein
MPPHGRGPSPSSSSHSSSASTEAAEESVYNLLEKTYAPPPKPPLYRSPRLRHAARQPPVASTIGAFGGPHLVGQARMERRAWAHWGPIAKQAADPKVRASVDPGRHTCGISIVRTTTFGHFHHMHTLMHTHAAQRFLRRGDGHKKALGTPLAQRPKPSTPDAGNQSARKPPVPSHVLPPSSQERVEWDHIFANAMDVITAVVRRVAGCLVSD